MDRLAPLLRKDFLYSPDVLFGATAARCGPHAQHQGHPLHQRWRALRRQRRPCLWCYGNVVVLSPFGGRSGTLPAGQFEGLRRSPEWGTDLASQVEALRKQGSRVEVITPDADSRAAMGTNQMDPATRIPAARAGFAQGKQEATRVTFL